MKFIARIACIAAIAAAGMSQLCAKEVTIYSVYGDDRLDVIFKPFTQRTGIKVNIVAGESTELIKKIQEEGENTLADLHLDKDLVYHGLANQAGIYQAFDSEVVEKNVPAQFKESGRNYVTLFYRARTMLYNKNTVNPAELSTYEDLASSKWNGRLCARVASNSYNQALAGFMVAHYGPAKAERIMKGWVANFGIAPLANDRAVIAAIAEGKCDVGLVNSYYLAPFIRDNADFPVKLFFANQKEDSKVHVNGVGIGITKYAKNVKEATLVLEYLTSAEVQAPVADAFSQYPVNPRAAIQPTLVDFGPFESDVQNVGTIANFVELGNSIMKKAGWTWK